MDLYQNSGIASLITASVIAMFWAAPYAAKMATLEVTQGMPLVMLFGKVFAYEELVDLALIGTQSAALLNEFLKVGE